MLSSVSALAAQNIGAGKHDRARETLRYALLIAGGFGIFIAILIQFIASPVVGLFTSDQTVIAFGSQYIRGYIFDCFLPGSISASAVTSVLTESPGFPFPQHRCDPVRANPGSLPDLKMVPTDPFPDGDRDCLWFSALSTDLHCGIRLAKTA